MSRKRKNEPNTILTDIRIEKAAAEGNSLAHVDGKVLFVSYSAPGDLADVEVIRQKSGYMQGRIQCLKEASPLREEPFCGHFGLCGGCKWQHLQYQEQLRQKQAQVRDNLERIGKVALPSDFPVLGAEANRYYRNKLEFTFAVKRWLSNEEVVSGEAMSEADRQGLGFHLAGKFDKVLDLQHCWLQAEPSNEIRLFVKKTAQGLGLTFYDVRARQGFMRNLMIRNTPSGEYMLVFVIGAEPVPAFELLMRRVAEAFPCVKSLMYAVNTKSNDSMADLDMRLFCGEPFITMTMPAYLQGDPVLKFRVGPKSFYQTNSQQAARLYRLVADFAGIKADEVVYDLYTGTGTIANYVARMAEKVVGIEYVEDAVRDARVNSSLNGISNTSFFAGDMAAVFNAGFVQEHGVPDVVITDPPREGMHEKVVECLMDDALFGERLQRLVYVSCNSATQARDLQRMDAKYRVLRVAAVDMFPHTDHVESVVLLERRR